MECPVVLPQGQQVAPEQARRPSFPDTLVTATVETPVSDGAGAPPQPHEQWWECCPLRAPLSSPCHNGVPCGVLVSVCVKGRANGTPRGVGQQELRWCLRVCGQSPGGRASDLFSLHPWCRVLCKHITEAVLEGCCLPAGAEGCFVVLRQCPP